jgi:hypothetical protein
MDIQKKIRDIEKELADIKRGVIFELDLILPEEDFGGVHFNSMNGIPALPGPLMLVATPVSV